MKTAAANKSLPSDQNTPLMQIEDVENDFETKEMAYMSAASIEDSDNENGPST
jgi:hypothetical protein